MVAIIIATLGCLYLGSVAFFIHQCRQAPIIEGDLPRPSRPPRRLRRRANCVRRLSVRAARPRRVTRTRPSYVAHFHRHLTPAPSERSEIKA